MQKECTLVYIVIMTIFLVSGCISNQQNPSMEGKGNSSIFGNQKTSPDDILYRPQNIEIFMAVTEGDTTRFYFTLTDGNGANTPGNGRVLFIISDIANRTVYESRFDIKASDFVDYEFKATGLSMGKTYEWRIKNSKIGKGVSSVGVAMVTFTSTSGKIMTATWPVVIPAYTQVEIEAMNEQSFSESAIPVNQMFTRGSFQVLVTKAGHFMPLSQLGVNQDYFRVDLEVRNVGNDREYFSPSGLALITGGNQYDMEWGGTLDTFSQIYPGVTKKGYILFKPVPQTIANVKLVFDLGYDNSYNPYRFEYDITLE